MLEKFINLFLPPTCIFCTATHAGTHGLKNICISCWHDLPSLSHSCFRCAQFLFYENEILCGKCLAHPPPFAITHALFPYTTPITELIIQLKFNQQLTHAKLLSELLLQPILHTWYKNKPLPQLIIPIPLHLQRLKERGFNQAVEIARPIAKQLNIPLDLHGITRTKYTAAQSGLTANERKHNMAYAFQAQRHYAGLSIAVLDDVITTGETITAFCQVLKQHGAKQIDVWCCARRG